MRAFAIALLVIGCGCAEAPTEELWGPRLIIEIPTSTCTQPHIDCSEACEAACDGGAGCWATCYRERGCREMMPCEDAGASD